MSTPNGATQHKHIHVFASDFLPFPGCPRSAGSNRSMQVIDALRAAGHRVTFSMPLASYLSKQYAQAILAEFTPEELWCCEYFFSPEIVLSRMEPDVAIYCNVNTFRAVRELAKETVHIVDFYGPLQFESLLLDAPDHEAAMDDAEMLENNCRQLVEKLRHADYLVTVSERQKYFWAAYSSLAGFTFRDLKILVCPAVFKAPQVSRNTSSSMTVVYSGGFYPWQSPDRSLRAAASILEEIDGAKLHIFGGPHAGLPNVAEVNALLTDLQRYRCVQYHGYRPVEELMTTLATAWCALELMEQNIERELAITGRTLEFLSSGTPVIYNNYSTLSGLIQKYEAGWTIAPADFEGLRKTFYEIAEKGPSLVEQRSANARQLAREEFKAEESMAELLQLCAGPISKRKKSFPVPVVRRQRTAALGKVLGISPDRNALAELRVNNPLRGLQRQGIIAGSKLSNVFFENLENDQSHYEAVLIQRAVPEFIYATLRNLGLPYLLDVDDNLLARASYRSDPTETEILPGLQHATAITAPSPRLVHLLEKYSGIPLANKAYITPNGLPFAGTALTRPYSQPKQLIWIQSDIAALTTSREAIVRAVEDFSRRHSLPIILIGPSVIGKPEFRHQVIMGQIDFATNLQLLEFAPTSIGIAPLETAADQETLDFVAGKSDLKMLLFAGYGHAGVYSTAPPYSDSPLQSCGSLAGNSYDQWTDALDYQYREGWRDAGRHAQRIQEERHIDAIARNSWSKALEACAFPKPMRGSELFEVFASARAMGTGPGQSIAYLLANRDVAAQYLADSDSSPWDHYREYGNREQRHLLHGHKAHSDVLQRLDRESTEIFEQCATRAGAASQQIRDMSQIIDSLQQEIETLRASYSWKITAPLRKAARPLMEGPKPRNG